MAFKICFPKSDVLLKERSYPFVFAKNASRRKNFETICPLKDWAIKLALNNKGSYEPLRKKEEPSEEDCKNLGKGYKEE